MLREFHWLRYLLGPLEDLRASEDELSGCYRLLIGDARLGRDYAEAFGDYLDKRLEDEIKTRQEMRKDLSARRRSRGAVTVAKKVVSLVLPGASAADTPAEQQEEDRAHRP